jgi:hypothetical protein
VESFYLIVISIALVSLVIFLSFIGVLMRNDSKTSIYPRNSSICPDYFVSDASGNCTMPTEKSFTDKTILLNTGKTNSSIMTDKTVAPYSTDGRSFNTTNLLWSSKGETTICAQKTWANNNNIVWDGVSNYNKC